MLVKDLLLIYNNNMSIKDLELESFYLLLKEAFLEDLNIDITKNNLDNGDITSRAIFDNKIEKAKLIAKEDAIISGIDYFKLVFKHFDKNIEVNTFFNDGDNIKKGDNIAYLKGNICSILEAERIAINFLSFLSGIATKTNKLVNIAKNKGSTVILDTRKTLPAYRFLSKKAVRDGKGQNHRMGLYDMILIKDNHIDASGSISEAIKRVKNKWGNKFKIEVECRNKNEALEALKAKVDVIMLDNMNLEDSRVTIEELKKINSNIKFECSGDMDEQKIEAYANIGVDYISSGALTHSVKSISYSMQIDK